MTDRSFFDVCRRGPTLARRAAVIGRRVAPLAVAVITFGVGLGLGGCGERAPDSAGRSVSSGDGPGAAAEIPEFETAAAVLEAFTAYRVDGETSRAEAVIDAAVRMWPADPDLRLAYGELLLTTERYEAAYRQYREALGLGVGDAGTSFAAGMAASLGGRHDAAAEHFKEAVRLEPGSPDYALHLGQALLRGGDLPGAKASLVRAAALDEGRAIVYGTLAEIALRENDPRMAAQHAGRARRLEPSVTHWRLIEARALKRAGEPQQAILVLRGAARGERVGPAVSRLMAECFGLIGRPGDALAAVEAAARAAESDAGLWFDAAAWAVRAAEGAAGLWFDAAAWAVRAGRPEAARRYAQTSARMGHEAAGTLLASLDERGAPAASTSPASESGE